MLELNHIHKYYNAGTVNEMCLFNDFSLSIEDGQFVSVVGSNGSGKTSMLNLICGSIPLDAGQIKIGNEDITNMPEFKRQKRIGRVYQNPAMGTCPSMTILENMALADNKGKPFNLRPGTNRQRVEFYREQLHMLGLGLEDKMDVKVLGTTFDVNTYEDEGKSFVVLVEGLVEVSAGKGESRIITPGHMAEVNMYDVQAKIQVLKCDTEHYVAWKNGNFSFRNASLTEILKRVSRYYDVTVIREQVFEEEYYTGDVSSDVSLESLLAVIESSTSVSFKVERKIVYVQKKRD